jgi:hypothetical protein
MFYIGNNNNFCIDEANKLAKILMTENIEDVFEGNGNAFFCLHVAVIFVSGIISISADKINITKDEILDAFIEQVKITMKNYKNKKIHTLYLVN